MAVVEIEGVSKHYGSHAAVKDLTLRVGDGELYGFIGPNGSGKTSTIRMILRIIFPDRGRIRVLGQDSASAANDAIGYLPEERGLYKKLSVRRMLHYYAALKGMKVADARSTINSWLQKFELEKWAGSKIETLSKGMAQKVQFIASIVAHPQLLILDEPFSGLDPVNAEIIRASILELRRQGSTVIFSTHDMSVAEKMCDSIFMIFRGEKVLDGSLASIKSRYGADTVHLRWNGQIDQLQALPEVARVVDLGAYQEIQFTGDPQQLLSKIVERGQVQLFEISQPSLHDIFIRIAGGHAADSSRVASQMEGQADVI